MFWRSLKKNNKKNLTSSAHKKWNLKALRNFKYEIVSHPENVELTSLHVVCCHRNAHTHAHGCWRMPRADSKRSQTGRIWEPFPSFPSFGAKAHPTSASCRWSRCPRRTVCACACSVKGKVNKKNPFFEDSNQFLSVRY